MTAQKFRLFFPDGDWFRDEDGHTEFTARRADAINEALAGHVDLERTPWPPPACDVCGAPATIVRPATRQRELARYCDYDAGRFLGWGDSFRRLPEAGRES